MTKVWAWLKKNWKWLIAPLWLLSVVLVWLFTGGLKSKPQISGTTDVAANTAVNTVVEAQVEKDTAIKQILKLFEEKLQKASVEQLKEFDTLKDKPVAEVVAWIDKF
jgi:hypothetical protein